MIKLTGLMSLLLCAFGCAADTFFVTNRYWLEAIPPSWINNCPNKVCVQKNWFQAPEIDYSYQFGYVAKNYVKLQSQKLGVVKSRPINVESPIFVDKLRNQLQKTNGRIIIFIHGYNVGFDDAIANLEKIDGRLNLSPDNATTLLYDWKSQGTLSGYPADSESSRVGALGFSYLIRALANDDSVREIHIIAHSMGNRVAVDGLERATWMFPGETSNPNRKKLQSIAYFASDINPQEHAAKLPRIHQYFNELNGVVFFSEYDKALRGSSLFNSSKKRAGSQDSGTTICVADENNKVTYTKSIPSVDVSKLSKLGKDPLGHSYILESPLVVQHLSSLFLKTPFNPPQHYLPGAQQFGDDLLGLLGCFPIRFVLP